ncbi:hypothetical protein [Brachybacterium tyrofermentans]
MNARCYLGLHQYVIVEHHSFGPGVTVTKCERCGLGQAATTLKIGGDR